MTVFIDVSQVNSDLLQESISPGLVIRDDYGRQIETILVKPDGTFESPAGCIRHEDLAQYILRITKHPRAGR